MEFPDDLEKGAVARIVSGGEAPDEWIRGERNN
jgi:hypothetical protein